MITKDT